MFILYNPIIDKITGKAKGFTFFSSKNKNFAKKSIKDRLFSSSKQSNINFAFKIICKNYQLLKLNDFAYQSWVNQAKIESISQQRLITCFTLFLSVFMDRYFMELGSSVIPVNLSPGFSSFYDDNWTRHWLISGWNVGGWNTGYYGR